MVLALLKQLLACPSITPNHAGCHDIIQRRLNANGFSTYRYPAGNVDNLWARYGQDGPLAVFAGHSDVVPPGPIQSWHSPPFTPTVRHQTLYARGATDMKSSLAAMIIAGERFVSDHPNFLGSIAYLITSDEEGDAIDGTAHALRILSNQGTKIDHVLVGEPTSSKQFGDTIKIGRRGSLNGVIRIVGVQGHVAYPQHAANPIHQAMLTLHQISSHQYAQANEHFPATQCQITSINTTEQTNNMIPANVTARLNFRFHPADTVEQLQQVVSSKLEQMPPPYRYDVQWLPASHPFLTPHGQTQSALISAVGHVIGQQPACSTSGGTSDARFFAAQKIPVVEFGPLCTSAHQSNEHIHLSHLDQLTEVYYQWLWQLFIAPSH